MKNTISVDIAQGDTERLNRQNFRPLLQALALPGSLEPFHGLYDSPMMAAASLLLYPEVTYHSNIVMDWSLIEAITGTTTDSGPHADYLFCGEAGQTFLEQAKSGSAADPEIGATLLIAIPDFSGGTAVQLTGPGVDGRLQCRLPVSSDFLQLRRDKNRHFPIGVDIFFLSDTKEVMGLPRSTMVDIL